MNVCCICGGSIELAGVVCGPVGLTGAICGFVGLSGFCSLIVDPLLLTVDFKFFVFRRSSVILNVFGTGVALTLSLGFVRFAVAAFRTEAGT